MELDSKIWSQLPEELVNKICNMASKITERNNALLEEIRFQTHMYSRWYYDTMSLFGPELAHYVMYDDMIHILNVPDTYPQNMSIEKVVEEMWRGITHEQRNGIIKY